MNGNTAVRNCIYPSPPPFGCNTTSPPLSLGWLQLLPSGQRLLVPGVTRCLLVGAKQQHGLTPCMGLTHFLQIPRLPPSRSHRPSEAVEAGWRERWKRHSCCPVQKLGWALGLCPWRRHVHPRAPRQCLPPGLFCPPAMSLLLQGLWWLLLPPAVPTIARPCPCAALGPGSQWVIPMVWGEGGHQKPPLSTARLTETLEAEDSMKTEYSMAGSLLPWPEGLVSCSGAEPQHLSWGCGPLSEGHATSAWDDLRGPLKLSFAPAE